MAKKSLQLGRAVEWPDTPEKAKLDRVPNPQAGTNYVVRFTAPEFTSLCPVTGQPDFAQRIAAEVKPKFLRIGGYWYPRGGIPIDVFWQTGRLPKGMWIPDQGVAPYRGRG
jgi:7-cyano-7-deazaguanine reductase